MNPKKEEKALISLVHVPVQYVHRYTVILAVVLILAVLTRKNKLCQGFTRGSSSIFSPANFLDQTQQKGLVMAVFGLVFSKLAMLVITPDPLPFSKDTPANVKEYMKIVAIFYYPVLYYPLLVCCTLQHKAGYVLGTLLSVGHFAVLAWQKFDCPKTPEIYKYYALLASLPQLACLAYLCVQFPLLFVKGPNTDEVRQVRRQILTIVPYVHSYFCLTMCVNTNILTNPSSSSSDKPTLAERILAVPKSYIYIPEKGASCADVSMIQTALLLVVLVVPTVHIVRAGIDENIAFLLLGFGIVLSDDRMEVVEIVTFYTWLLEVCYLCAMTLSCLVSLIMLMRSMVLHRSNLRGLYKGDVYSVYNSQKTIRPSKPGVVCWIGLTGYQAAIVCVGMGIQTVVFFICFLFLVFLIIMPVFYGRNLIAFTMAGKAWPGWVTVTLVTALQHVAAKFAFIKKEAGTRDLNNRFSLFLLTYLLFLINIVVGLIVAIWRMVITALYNIVHLGRIDVSLLHRTAESYDPAYRYYAHSLKVEVSQSHPVMKAFCGLLLDMMIEGGGAAQKIRDAEEGKDSQLHIVSPLNGPNEATGHRRVRSRWQLLYTLVNNPSLLGSRKHFQTQQTSETVPNATPNAIPNATPNRSSKKGSVEVEPAAKPVRPTETPTNQDKTD
uniref:Receptor for retinol uptake STRA6 n=1 Tax=Cyclopterus lumpus TaxID=8103 RepID=A0A8C3AYS8_CYCLU